MKGMVAKHIERRNFFHSNDVHWKWLIVKLTGQPVLKVREPDSSPKREKKFALHNITALNAFEGNEVCKKQE
jgi:hypothetical protein